MISRSVQMVRASWICLVLHKKLLSQPSYDTHVCSLSTRSPCSWGLYLSLGTEVLWTNNLLKNNSWGLAITLTRCQLQMRWHENMLSSCLNMISEQVYFANSSVDIYGSSLFVSSRVFILFASASSSLWGFVCIIAQLWTWNFVGLSWESDRLKLGTQRKLNTDLLSWQWSSWSLFIK